MYKSAEPPLDFYDLLTNPDEYGDEWYNNHHLSQEEKQRIFQEHVEDENLTDGERISLRMSCLLTLGPTSTPNEK